MTREEYLKTYRKYLKMNSKTLERNVGQLYSKKFEDNNIEVYNEHRIATRALLERNRTTGGLIYHLKNIVIKSC